jgi:hypothetical protein
METCESRLIGQESLTLALTRACMRGLYGCQAPEDRKGAPGKDPEPLLTC